MGAASHIWAVYQTFGDSPCDHLRQKGVEEDAGYGSTNG